LVHFALQEEENGCADSTYLKRWRVCAALHADGKLICGSHEAGSKLMLFICGCPMTLALQWATKNKISK